MKNDYITIANFTYASEAQILKGKLQSEGIQVYLSDEHIINIDPLFSNAIGGIKLNVLTVQKEKALAVLKTISTYSVNDQGKLITCPNCQKKTVGYYSTVRM